MGGAVCWCVCVCLCVSASVCRCVCLSVRACVCAYLNGDLVTQLSTSHVLTEGSHAGLQVPTPSPVKHGTAF